MYASKQGVYIILFLKDLCIIVPNPKPQAISANLQAGTPFLKSQPHSNVHQYLYSSSPTFSSSTYAFNTLTSSTGLSSTPVFTNPILFKTPNPLVTLPKIVCFPSNHGVGANVIKNWLPFVFGPELAMLRIPAPVCFSSGEISSSNFSP